MSPTRQKTAVFIAVLLAFVFFVPACYAQTVSINSDAVYSNSTAVTLTLSVIDTDSGMGGGAEMQFSNDNINWSTPEAYVTTKAWTLTNGDGLKTVYAKYKDVAGNWLEAVSDTIILDTQAPRQRRGI